MYIPKTPFVICMDITNRCNLNCRHCSVDALEQGKSMPTETIISIIDEAKRIGVRDLVFGGGEPMLHENFREICLYVLSKGLNLSFTTNGTLVSENLDFFQEASKYGSLRIGVSLDGHTAELHGYFRPKETFEEAKKAIKLLSKIGIEVQVLYVLNKTNATKIPEFLSFISNLRISNLRILPFIPIGRGKRYREEMPSPEDFYSIILKKREWSKIYKVNIGFHMPWEFLFLPSEKRNPSPCEAGYLRLWIDSNGNILACPYIQDLPIGNIFKDEISDVWINSPILRKFRDTSLLKGVCATCDYLKLCCGGCRGLAHFLLGDFLCSDPYCPRVNQKLLR